jgi:hypothetical protein
MRQSKQASSETRAARPISLMREPFSPIRMPFWLDRSTMIAALMTRRFRSGSSRNASTTTAGRVRHLVAGLRDQLLADDLGREKALALLGHLIERIERRAHRQLRRHDLEQALDVVAGLAAHRHDVGVRDDVLRGGAERDHRRLADEVALGERDHVAGAWRRRWRRGGRRGHAEPRRRHEHADVAVPDRLPGRRDQAGVQRRLGGVDAGRVDEHQLGVRAVQDSDDAVPRRLRLVRDGGERRSDDLVQESRLPDVRPPDQRDEAGPVVCSPSVVINA